MTQRAAIRARRQALRARIRARRAEARRRVRAARRAQDRKRDPRRGQRRLLLCAAGLFLLLLSRCAAEGPLPPSSPGTLSPPQAPTAKGTDVPRPPPLPRGAPLPTASRPTYAPVAPPEHPWLETFRLQVAARSPRLAACFEGVSEPGALQWTTGVEPATGRVVDSTVAPLSSTAPLAQAQQACVQDVLSSPTYTLPAVQGPSRPPTRVRLLLEF